MAADAYAAQEQRRKIAMRLMVDNFARMDQERLRRQKNFQCRDPQTGDTKNIASEKTLTKFAPRKTRIISADELFVGIFCKTPRTDAATHADAE